MSKMVLSILLTSCSLLPQSASTGQSNSASPSFDPDTAPHDPLASSAPAALGTSETPLSRWLDLTALSLSIRYRGAFDTFGTHEFSQWSERSLIAGRFKFDSAGKYSIGFRASSGQYYDWAYADFAGGGNVEAILKELPALYRQGSPALLAELQNSAASLTPAMLNANLASGGWSIYVRELYFSAKPVDWLRVDYGGIGINRGLGTEMTTYDDDGFLEGGRVSLLKPERLYFDEVSATFATVGNPTSENLFVNGQNFLQSNYHQFLVRKRFNNKIEASADFTHQRGNTVREAVLFKIPETKVLDSLRVELYQRPTTRSAGDYTFDPGYGYGFTGTKKIGSKLQIQAGIADIDNNYGVYGVPLSLFDVFAFTLNGDQYGQGRRYFVRPTLRLTPYLSFFGYCTHTFDRPNTSDNFVWNKQAVNIGMTVDFKGLLEQKKILTATR